MGNGIGTKVGGFVGNVGFTSSHINGILFQEKDEISKSVSIQEFFYFSSTFNIQRTENNEPPKKYY